MAGVKVVKYLYEVAELSDTIFKKIGIDGWVSEEQKYTFITHNHEDHVPKYKHTKLLVPSFLYYQDPRFFEKLPNPIITVRKMYRVIGRVLHWNVYRLINDRYVPADKTEVYLFKVKKKKVVVVGDYDSWQQLFNVLKEVQPDIAIMPIYAKKSRRYDRLYNMQINLLRKLKKEKRHWIKAPVVIGLKHSRGAEPVEYIDYFVTEKNSVV